MKILIVYFSFTSNVQTLAEAVQAEVEQRAHCTVARLEPRKPRGYWGWLVRSFVPYWRVAIKTTVTDLDAFDLIFLGFPKWTLSCPPLNEYLRRMRFQPGRRFALFMSYGGFDQERYLRDIVRRLMRKGADVVAVEPFKRRFIREQDYHSVISRFCRRAGVE